MAITSYPETTNVLSNVHGEVSSTSFNSSTTPIASGATFTGTGELNDWGHVGVSCQTDNSGTLFFEFSVDNTNWTTFPVGGYSVSPDIHEFHTAVKLGRYFRTRLVNDIGAQSYLRLTTYYGNNFVPSSSPINQSISLDGDAISTRPTSFQDEVQIGRRGEVRGWNKFAYREGLTATGGFETVWAATGNFTPMTTADTFEIAYNDTNDGADAGATGAETLFIEYIDSDGLPAVGLHTLGSSSPDTTSFSGLGINRVAVASSGTSQYNVNDITVSSTTSGDTQAVVPAEGSVTQQAIFFVGANHEAVAKYLYINILKTSGGSSPRVSVRGQVYNRAVDTYYEVFRSNIDTDVENTVVLDEPIGFNLSSSDVLIFSADTDQNNTDAILRFSLNEYQNN